MRAKDIDKGLFRYDAYLLPDTDSGSGENEWYLASTLDREAYEFPVMMAAVQSLWNASAGTWLDRTADLRVALSHGAVDPMCVKDCSPGQGIVTPGVWMKGFGGTYERDMNRQTSAPPMGLVGPTYTYDGSYDQDAFGFMGGVDFGTRVRRAVGPIRLGCSVSWVVT